MALLPSCPAQANPAAPAGDQGTRAHWPCRTSQRENSIQVSRGGWRPAGSLWSPGVYTSSTTQPRAIVYSSQRPGHPGEPRPPCQS